MKTDIAIRKAVLGKLKADATLKLHEITVDVNQGVVTLSGYVGDILTKRLAERFARHIKDVRVVSMNLQIACPNGDNDARIATEIADAFAGDPRLADEPIRAMVDNGWVTLEGRVDDYCQRAVAFNAVNDIEHVRGVTNRITVKM